MEHPSEKARREYLHEHPKADPKNHTVRKVDPTPQEAPREKQRFRNPTNEEVQTARTNAKKTTWSKPSLDDELVEVERKAKELGDNKKHMLEAFKT